MSNAIGDILGKRNPSEPAEFETIRKFVEDNCGFLPSLSIHNGTIVINAPSAAEAGLLRFKLHELQSIIDKKLIIRIR